MALTGTGLTTTDGIDLNEVLYGTVLPIVNLYNREETLDVRAMLTSDWTEQYFKADVSGQWKFQKLGEAEKPRYRSMVYGRKQKDTVKYGLGLGYTYDWLISNEASASEIRSWVQKAIERDRALEGAVILDVALTNGSDGWWNGSYTSDEKLSTPPSYGQNTFAAGHTHYTASGNTSLRLSDIVTAKKTIKEHGFAGPFFGFASADTVADIENLAGWASRSSAEFPVSSPVVNNVAIDGFAGRLLGVDWKETQWMPDNYILIVAPNIPGEARRPINYIQKANTSARGLVLLPGSFDARYPIVDAWYAHWLTAQVIFRGAGAVTQFASSYSSPSVLGTVVE